MKNAAALPPIDKTKYKDLVKLRVAAWAHCIREFPMHWPFIELIELRRLMAQILCANRRRNDPTSAGLLERELLFGKSNRLLDGLAARRLPVPITFERFCDAMFRAAPTGIKRHEALVRVLEYLTVRDADEAFKLPLPNSRPFAVASIATREKFMLRGEGPWSVTDVIEAEGKAMWHQVKKLAEARLLSS